MVFGRAGEEIAALRKAGIRYHIVPGITSALAAAADAAMSPTLRKVRALSLRQPTVLRAQHLPIGPRLRHRA